jgi:hypothetical protein
MLRDSIVSLRAENSQLMNEIIELKSDMGLKEDQVMAVLVLSYIVELDCRKLICSSFVPVNTV